MSVCAVSFEFNDIDGSTPLVGADFVFKLQQWGSFAGAPIQLRQGKKATTDALGQGSIDLWVNGDSEKEAVYRVTFPSGESAQFIIPTATASENLSDLLIAFPDNDPQIPVVLDLKADRDASNIADPAQADPWRAALSVETSAQLDARDAANRSRANHTGTQLAATISDFDAAVEANAKVASIETGAEVNDPTTVLDADIGTTVQAWDDDLDDLAALTHSDRGLIQSDGTDWTAATEADLIIPSRQPIKSVQASTITSSYVSIPDDPSVDLGTGDFSIFMWLKIPSDRSSTFERIIQKTSPEWLVQLETNGALTCFASGNGSLSVSGYKDDQWHFHVFTFERGVEIRHYADGILNETVATAVTADLDSSGDLQFFGTSGGQFGTYQCRVGNYLGVTKDLIAASEALKMAKDPHYALQLDNLAACVEVPAPNVFVDRSPNAATVSPTGSLNYEGYETTGTIGVTVQAWDDDLDDLAALTHTDRGLIQSDGTDWNKVAESGIAIPSRQSIKSFQAGSTTSALTTPDNAAIDLGLGDFSFAFKLKVPSSTSVEQYLYEKWDGQGVGLLVSTSSELLVYIGQALGSGGVFYTVATNVNDGLWHSYVISCDRSGSAVCYIDGVAQSSVSISAQVAVDLDNTVAAGIFGEDTAAATGINKCFASDYFVLAKDIITQAEAVSLAIDADYWRVMDNIAMAVGIPSEETFIDYGPNSLPLTLRGSFNYFGYEKLQVPTTTITTTSYTARVTDSVILVDDDTAGGAVTITLPAAATAGNGFTLTIKKLGSTADVTIDGDGTETIDDSLTNVIKLHHDFRKLISDGSNWKVIG